MNKTFEAVIPDGVTPGKVFKIRANGQLVDVTCPPGMKAGEKMRVQVPAVETAVAPTIPVAIAVPPNTNTLVNSQNFQVQATTTVQVQQPPLSALQGARSIMAGQQQQKIIKIAVITIVSVMLIGVLAIVASLIGGGKTCYITEGGTNWCKWNQKCESCYVEANKGKVVSCEVTCQDGANDDDDVSDSYCSGKSKPTATKFCPACTGRCCNCGGGLCSGFCAYCSQCTGG